MGGAGSDPGILFAGNAVNIGGGGSFMIINGTNPTSPATNEYAIDVLFMDNNGLNISNSLRKALGPGIGGTKCVVGGKAGTDIYPGFSVEGIPGSSVDPGGTPHTELHVDVGTALARLSAYWIFHTNMSAAQGADACLILSELVNTLEVLD